MIDIVWMWLTLTIMQLISMSLGYKIFGLAGLYLFYILVTIACILIFPYYFGLVGG